jgi:hypothetical protein
MKGDRVEVIVDTGNGTRSFEIDARRAGRRVEVASGRGLVEVSEVTRGGTVIRSGRFMAGRVVAIVEHPARGEQLVPGEPLVEVAEPRRPRRGP